MVSGCGAGEAEREALQGRPGAVPATASWVISGSIYRFRLTTMTNVNDLQIGSAFPGK
jgi:hypothetical protein